MTYYTRQPFQKAASGAEIERLLHHLPTVAQLAEEPWVEGFAKSVLKQSRRRGWSPSPRQLPVMRQLVNALFTRTDGGADDIQMIED
ncbi:MULTISPECIES: hypothetical protein [unclassified Sulfitobacter]|uniref:hypothetical protein n=1 Tax=unclassified Sulfitobacter TaxID=196795 RepID=UPI0007C30D5D|nr:MULTISPECIES: hypothetical protein [unclassified Sulfitobacter]KZX94487.1 hypothetical protein A3720_04525 [Sulfitobacter sp. HI0021]KZY02145.1 hypothetical protein A3722_06385 [Sulfitobacter sp. HI0027]KZY99471.1 hypothetical protein A3747_00750 [Sulfitobacter sp. HI0076]